MIITIYDFEKLGIWQYDEEEDPTFTAPGEIKVKDQDKMHQHVKGLYPDYDKDKNRIVLINPNASELLIQRRWMPEKYIELHLP